MTLQPGDPFPDFELPDHAGNPRRLSELVAGDPTVLHFYRGWWCPKEQRYLRRLLELQDEAEVGYVRLAPRVLHVGAGVLGRVPWPAGPVIERYGSAQPWPADRFG